MSDQQQQQLPTAQSADTATTTTASAAPHVAASLGDFSAVVAAAAASASILTTEPDQSAGMQVEQPQSAPTINVPTDAGVPEAVAPPSNDASAIPQGQTPVDVARAATAAYKAEASTHAHEQAGDMSLDASPQKSAASDMSYEQGTPKPKKERAKPKPRSKSATKITRFRKITSCLQCREKKQKCDRVKPTCGNCQDNLAHDPCHYVDDEQKRHGSDEESSQNGAFSSPLPRKRKHGDDPQTPGQEHQHKRADFPRIRDRRHAHFLEARRQMVDKLANAGKDRSRDFNSRVNSARAAAVADVLFESDIVLPTADQVSNLMYTYKTEVEPFVNVVITDINMARFMSFLRWWHSKPTTMPTDPPLVPLLLVMLALAMQAKRTSIENEGREIGNMDPLPGIECSDERTLLVIAGHAIDALQIACPSAWSSAFQAPIDLIKAALLRGVWHLNELNLQFAGTCFATTTRLAYAAGLHRDPKHWSDMKIEEAQARRNLWWNIVFYEVAHAYRLGQPPCLTHKGFDTNYPDDYDALCALYEYAGLADADSARIILPSGSNALVPRTPTRTNFDYHWARFRIYHIFLRHSQQLFRFGIASPQDPNLNDDYAKWKDQLPAHFKVHLDRRLEGSVLPSDECLARVAIKQPNKGIFDPLAREEYESYLQGYNLELMYHQSMITIHRPYINEQGAWKPAESVQKSLEVCLNSSEAIIGTVNDLLSINPPFSMYNLCAYFSFNAGLVLAIHCKLDPTSQKHRPALQRALDNLNQLAGMSRLDNIAEQAGRYATTLKQMLQGSGRDLAQLASEAVAAAEKKEEDGLAALDPSLTNDPAAAKPAEGEVAAGQVAQGAEKIPERLPAFLLPFVGLPPDMNNLGPQADLWSIAGVASGLPPLDYSSQVGNGQNVGSWPPPEQAGPSGSTSQDDATDQQYNTYYDSLVGSKPDGATRHTQLPDRPMSFSQHYNHQNPSRALAEQQQMGAPKPYDESASRTTADDAGATEFEAPVFGQPGAAEGDKAADSQSQQNNLAGMWYAWENFSQMLNNRQ